MNDEQIVLSLLSFYRNEGIDLHQLLDDPIFNSLSLQTKIQMIKRYAQDIHDGVHVGLTRHDMKGVGKDMLFHGIMGGMTGAAATAATSKLFAGGKISPMAIALGAASGAGSGLGLSVLRRWNSHAERAQLKQYLNNVAQDPTDEKALHTLALRNLQGRTRGEDTASYNKFVDRIAQNADERARDAAQRQTVLTNTMAGRDWTEEAKRLGKK